MAAAFEHGAVHRHFLTGAHAQVIARMDFIERHVHIALGLHHTRGLRLQAQQFLNGAAGAGASAEFQHLAEQHEHDDHRRGFKIERQVAMSIGEGFRKTIRHQHDGHAEGIRSADSKRDEREHVHAVMPQGDPRALKERPSGP